MARFTLVRLDDWIGLFDGDRLLHEGHSIQEDDLLRLVGVDAESEWADAADRDHLGKFGGRFPSSLAEFREAYSASDEHKRTDRPALAGPRTERESASNPQGPSAPSSRQSADNESSRDGGSE